jgi:hypothetical protein
MAKVKKIKRAEAWHETKQGLLFAVFLEVGFAYVFLSWAIDTGSTLDYFFTVLFVIGVFISARKLISKLFGPNESKKGSNGVKHHTA